MMAGWVHNARSHCEYSIFSTDADVEDEVLLAAVEDVTDASATITGSQFHNMGSTGVEKIKELRIAKLIFGNRVYKD